jgi:hypothetical protein
LQFGADAGVLDHEGNTPLVLALQSITGHLTCTESLVNVKLESATVRNRPGWIKLSRFSKAQVSDGLSTYQCINHTCWPMPTNICVRVCTSTNADGLRTPIPNIIIASHSEDVYRMHTKQTHERLLGVWFGISLLVPLKVPSLVTALMMDFSPAPISRQFSSRRTVVRRGSCSWADFLDFSSGAIRHTQPDNAFNIFESTGRGLGLDGQLEMVIKKKKKNQT